jgi:hypothetical protein
LRVIRLVLAFLLTLLLFWIVPPAGSRDNADSFYEVSLPNLSVDHLADTRWSKGGNPELTATVTTSLSPDDYQLMVRYRTDSVGTWQGAVMRPQEGSLDRYTAELPRLTWGRSYSYHIQLLDGDGEPLARLPEATERDITLRFLGRVPDWLSIGHTLILFLTIMAAWLTLFDAVWLRSRNLRLGDLLPKVIAVSVFLVAGVVSSALINHNLHGAVWQGWPFGLHLAESLRELTTMYWIGLTLLLIVSILSGKTSRRLVSAGGTSILALTGLILVIAVHLTEANGFR